MNLCCQLIMSIQSYLNENKMVFWLVKLASCEFSIFSGKLVHETV